MSKRIIICSKCGLEKNHGGKGLCTACYSNFRYWSNHEKLTEYNKHRREVDAERINAAKKRYLENNPERRKQSQRDYYYNNPEKVKESATKYRLKNMDRRRATFSRYQARKYGLPADLTVTQWHQILKEYDQACAYCGVKSVKLEKDHIIPVTRGGGFTASNIVPACRSCNASKRDKTDSEFKEYLKNFPTRNLQSVAN